MELNINISQNQSVHEKIKKIIGLTNLDALYLTEKEIENIFEFSVGFTPSKFHGAFAPSH